MSLNIPTEEEEESQGVIDFGENEHDFGLLHQRNNKTLVESEQGFLATQSHSQSRFNSDSEALLEEMNVLHRASGSWPWLSSWGGFRWCGQFGPAPVVISHVSDLLSQTASAVISFFHCCFIWTVRHHCRLIPTAKASEQHRTLTEDLREMSLRTERRSAGV
jgi:hypothetical protein